MVRLQCFKCSAIRLHWHKFNLDNVNTRCPHLPVRLSVIVLRICAALRYLHACQAQGLEQDAVVT